jgi:hypothetical protein
MKKLRAMENQIDRSDDQRKSIEPQLIINDIDLPLYTYGFFHRQDLNNYFDTESKRQNQKNKSLIITIWNFFNAVRYALHFKYLKNGRVPLYFFDVLQFIGGITEYFYGVAGLLSLLSFHILYLFNFSKSEYFQWLDIIKVLKGIQNMETIKIYDKIEMRKFVTKIRIIKKFIRIVILCSNSFITLMPISTIIFQDLEYILKYGILSGISFCAFAYFVIFIPCYSFLYYFIVCYYCRIRFKSFNRKIGANNNKIFIKNEFFDALLEEHNEICDTIILYNKFWSKYYFALTYSLIPVNLMLIEEIAFHKLNFATFGVASTFCFGAMFCHLLFNSITGSINAEAVKSYKFMHQFLIDTKFSVNIKRKIKVCFYYILNNSFLKVKKILINIKH